MPYVDLDIPDGVVTRGTPRAAKGYWRDADHVRWPLQPIGGYREKSSAVTGTPRAMVAWRDTASGATWAAIGTHSKLYVMNRAGTLFDITPVGFTAGRTTASSATGYGAGNYGAGAYGAAALDATTILPATVWTLDNFGQYLVGCSEEDGKLYEWTLNTGTVAAQISGAPTGCNGLVTTAERFLVAIKDQQLLWCDQDANTTWTAAATNQAGDINLQTPGTFMCGRRVAGATLIFSDVDVWAMQYVGGVAVFGFQRVGSDCGTVSKGSPISLPDGGCAWWGKGAFHRYNGGAITEIACPIYEQTISNINPDQASKVTSWINPENNEVWWHYPSLNSTENDKAVAWNYTTGTWTTHTLARLAGAGAGGVFLHPLAIGTDFKVYEHETGYSWGVTPYARSAPYEIGAGDNVMMVTGVVGDEKTLGESQVTIYARDYPNNTETAYGPYSLSTQPDHGPRLTARQIEVKVGFTDPADSRVGVIRLEMKPKGRR